MMINKLIEAWKRKGRKKLALNIEEGIALEVNIATNIRDYGVKWMDTFEYHRCKRESALQKLKCAFISAVFGVEPEINEIYKK